MLVHGNDHKRRGDATVRFQPTWLAGDQAVVSNPMSGREQLSPTYRCTHKHTAHRSYGAGTTVYLSAHVAATEKERTHSSHKWVKVVGASYTVHPKSTREPPNRSAEQSGWRTKAGSGLSTGMGRQCQPQCCTGRSCARRCAALPAAVPVSVQRCRQQCQSGQVIGRQCLM